MKILHYFKAMVRIAEMTPMSEYQALFHGTAFKKQSR